MFGFPEPFAKLIAFLIRTATGATFVIKVKDLSKNYKVGIPINTNSIIPNYAGCIYEVHNSYGMNSSHIENTLGKYMNNPDLFFLSKCRNLNLK